MAIDELSTVRSERKWTFAMIGVSAVMLIATTAVVSDEVLFDLRSAPGITSAILDRVLHHAETVVIEGKSFRMKDQIEPPA